MSYHHHQWQRRRLDRKRYARLNRLIQKRGQVTIADEIMQAETWNRRRGISAAIRHQGETHEDHLPAPG